MSVTAKFRLTSSTRLSHRDQRFGRFPSWEDEVLNDAFAALLRAFWLEDKGHEVSKARYKWNFGGFPERLGRRSC